MRTFSGLEESILNRVQRDIELSETPFSALSQELSINEDTLLNILNKFKIEGIIRNISAIFNSERLGYSGALIAFNVNENNINNAAEIINAHPGVSHNYLRDHKYNIWFTITGRDGSLNESIAGLVHDCGVSDYLVLKKKYALKIGLMLNMGNYINDKYLIPEEYTAEAITFSDEEKKAIFLLQKNIPLINRPFRDIVMNDKIISEKRLIEMGNSLKAKKIMRRFAAILRHQRVGYTTNALTAWSLNNKNEKDIALIFGSIPNISHLYIRDAYPGTWEYPLFAMIHAKSVDELKHIITDMESRSGIHKYLVLNTLKEFKKERIIYYQ